jgi:GNAT superfamily N-acetyltransferase
MKSERWKSARLFARKLFSIHPSQMWSVDVISQLPMPEQSRFEVRRITSPDDPLLDDLDSDLFDHAYYRKCLARGDFGLAVLDGPKCAGRTWVTTTSHRDAYTGLRITLGPGEAFSFGSWVEPSYRRLGAASVLLGSAWVEANRDGATVFYGAVESGNKPMQKVGLPLGWSKNEDVVFVRILNRLGLQVPFSVRPRTGPLAPRRRYLRTLGRKIFSVHPAHMWSVDVTPDLTVPEQTGFELRRITSPDDPLLDDLDSDLFDHAYYRKCLARGDFGLAALDGTTCAGRTWVTTASHRDKYSGLRITLAPGEAWCFGLWVEPHYRLRGMGLILLAGSMRELTREGATAFHGVVESDNKASQAVLTSLGWVKNGDVVFVRILNRVGLRVPFSVRQCTGPAAPRRRLG